MNKNYIIALSFVLCITVCRTEDPKQEKTRGKSVYPITKYCCLLNINQEGSKYLAAIDFIEYKKVTEIDSMISADRIIELPNGFCYLNKEQVLEQFELPSEVGILMQTFSYNNEGNFNFNQAVKLEEFLKSYNDPQFLRLKSVPFRILISGSKIDSLFEIYVP